MYEKLPYGKKLATKLSTIEDICITPLPRAVMPIREKICLVESSILKLILGGILNDKKSKKETISCRRPPTITPTQRAYTGFENLSAKKTKAMRLMFNKEGANAATAKCL